jgi:hypothetical protein
MAERQVVRSPHLDPLQRRGLFKTLKSPSPLERGWGEALTISTITCRYFTTTKRFCTFAKIIFLNIDVGYLRLSASITIN